MIKNSDNLLTRFTCEKLLTVLKYVEKGRIRRKRLVKWQTKFPEKELSNSLCPRLAVKTQDFCKSFFPNFCRSSILSLYGSGINISGLISCVFGKIKDSSGSSNPELDNLTILGAVPLWVQYQSWLVQHFGTARRDSNPATAPDEHRF